MNSKKILMVHNYYQIPGGEDVVVANEMELLKNHGHEVILYSRHNNEINKMNPLQKAGLFFSTIYNRRTYKEVCEIIKKENIDVVHVHNTLNLVSPSVFYAAKKCKVPVINTIHNFRMLCAAATLYRDGKICEKCIDGGYKCALKGKCYRNSLAQTFTVVLMALINRARGIYKHINYICLTEFNKNKLLEVNKKGNIVDPNKVFVKPNFMKILAAEKNPEKDLGDKNISNEFVSSNNREDYIFFAARLDESKGIEDLLEACKGSRVKVLVAGSGPLEEKVKEQIQKNPEINAEFLGKLEHDEVINKIKKARAIVLPTRWYEGFPMSIVESFSVGTPVIGPNMGNVGNIVTDGVSGYLYEAGNIDSLRETLNKFEMGKLNDSLYQGAYKEFKTKYTDEINYKILIDIYSKIQTNN